MNSLIIDEFTKLADQLSIDKSGDNRFRLQQTLNIISIIKNYPKKITKGEQIAHLKGIGKGTVDRINEILKNGYLSEIKINTQNTKYINKLKEVFGIGDDLAYKLVTKFKIKSPEALIKAHKSGKIELNKQVITGLKYYKKYKKDIPRREITAIDKYLHDILKKLDRRALLVICGSYRRLKMHSNDIDVLLVHPKNKKDFLLDFVNILKKQNFILDDLTYKDYQTKYMGFCRLGNNPIRRIDIRYMPYESYYPALLYFTGSGEFNRKMRDVAITLGYKLNEYGLYDRETNKLIKVNSEKEIFDKLGMEYLPPEKRSH